jgi:hypothetical protein
MRTALPVALLGAALVLIGPSARGGLVSSGCAALRDHSLDAFDAWGEVDGHFDTGDVVVATALPPSAQGPVQVGLWVDGNAVDQAAFPGSVSMVMGEGDRVVVWGVVDDDEQFGPKASWTVTCRPRRHQCRLVVCDLPIANAIS